MALALATPTVTDSWFDGKRLHVVGTIAIGASPLTYAAGGPVLNFNGVGILSGLPPVRTDVSGRGGFIYKFLKGTTIANGTLAVFAEGTVAANAPLVEHTTAAIAAGVSGDTIDFYAIFKLR